MSNNDLARNADTLEASNHASEVTSRALAALERAITLSTLLVLSTRGADQVSRGAQEAVRDLLHGDMVATRNALGEATRMLAKADPLGCIDTSPEHEALAKAKGDYHEALAALGVDPLELAA